MKSNYRIFTAVFLSAIMTAAAPLTLCGAEVFSVGESFSDGTGRDWNGISGTALINLGIHAEGQQSQDRLFLYNAGTDSLYLSDFPQSRYFDFSYAPSFDTNTDEKMQPGSCAAVDIVDKKNLPAGKIMVTDGTDWVLPINLLYSNLV